MATKVLMPKLGASMESGTILQWFKDEGETVSEGEVLFEVMTDKINIEIEAEASGVLLKKLYDVDEEVPVNHVIAYIGEEGEKIEIEENSTTHSFNEANRSVLKEKVSEKNELKNAGKIRATPAARKLARDNHIELHLIKGSGPRGRIQADDVKEYLARKRR